MLTAILVVSIFCQSTIVYAIDQKEKEREQQQQIMVQQLQETADRLSDKVHYIYREKKIKERKQLYLKIKKKYQKIAAEQRRKAAAEKIVKYANNFVGNPYVWGGNSLTNGCDCSHFVYNVIKDTTKYSGGYVTSQNWARKGKKVKSLKQAQPGDVIVYPGHVAIYDGKGKIIEAQCAGVGITNNRNAGNASIIAIRRFV